VGPREFVAEALETKAEIDVEADVAAAPDENKRATRAKSKANGDAGIQHGAPTRLRKRFAKSMGAKTDEHSREMWFCACVGRALRGWLLVHRAAKEYTRNTWPRPADSSRLARTRTPRHDARLRRSQMLQKQGR
jgi:hypothetical protein